MTDWTRHAGAPLGCAPDFARASALAQALALALEGVPVFPVFGMKGAREGLVCECNRRGEPPAGCSPGKHPRLPFKSESTTDLDRIWQWAERWPRGNFGAATGGGLVVIDLDGAQAFEALAKLESALGALPQTWTTRSGRDGPGEHRWFSFDPAGPEPANSAGALGPGIDIRGRGGFVVVPGSIHKSGRRYAWIASPEEVELAPIPPAWLARLAPGTPRAAKRGVSGGGVQPLRKRPQGAPTGPHDASLPLIGDGPGYGGFDLPIYKAACRYFAAGGPAAPAEPLIAALRQAVESAPKGAGRDVTRYLSADYLTRRCAQAREFIKNNPQ